MSDTLRISVRTIGDFIVSTIVANGYFETAVFNDAYRETIPAEMLEFAKNYSLMDHVDSIELSLESRCGVRCFAFADAYAIHSDFCDMVSEFTDTHKRVVSYVSK